MPVIRSTTITVVCDYCAATAVFTVGTESPMWEEWFFARRWSVLEQDNTAVCPLCKPVTTPPAAPLTARIPKGAAA